jgi:coenzyme F420-reducing hydrogenase delta subunit
MSEFQPKIVAFLCNWCSYAAADLAGTQRLDYPPNVKIIRVMCSGRVDPGFVMQALLEGADGVLIAGCHHGDCHYGHGNRLAQRRTAVVRSLLDFVGVEPERIRMGWASAAEGKKFKEMIETVIEDMRPLGPAASFRRYHDSAS